MDAKKGLLQQDNCVINDTENMDFKLFKKNRW